MLDTKDKILIIVELKIIDDPFDQINAHTLNNIEYYLPFLLFVLNFTQSFFILSTDDLCMF